MWFHLSKSKNINRKTVFVRMYLHTHTHTRVLGVISGWWDYYTSFLFCVFVFLMGLYYFCKKMQQCHVRDFLKSTQRQYLRSHSKAVFLVILSLMAPPWNFNSSDMLYICVCTALYMKKIWFFGSSRTNPHPPPIAPVKN